MGKRIQSEIPRIIPQPQEIQRKTGSAVFGKDAVLWLGKSNQNEVRRAIQPLQDKLTKMLNGNVIAKAAPDTLEGDGFLIGKFDDHSALSSLADSAKRVQLGQEGYALDISEHTVCLGANDPVGLFYGVQTLLQLMQPCGEGKLSIPQLSISDWPNMAWRAVHCFPPSEEGLPPFKQVLTELLPRYKINTLIFEVNYRFPYQSHPEVAEPNAFSKEVYREITALARGHFIQLIPQFTCLGHQSWSEAPLLRTHPEFDETPWLPLHNPDIYCGSWCPLHPDVNRFVFDLFDELIDVFQPKAFHVGMDEVFILGDDRCPRCKNKPKHELFAKAVNDLHAYLNGEKGLTMLMWGDRLLDAKKFDYGYGGWEASENATAEAINLIPQDIIVCDWHYGVRDTYPSLKYFQDKGFRVLAAGGKSPGNVRKFNQYAYQVQSDKMLGQLATTWISPADAFCHALLTGQGNKDARNVATCFKIVGEQTWNGHIAGCAKEGQFADPNLEAVISEAINKSEGFITKDDLEGITFLEAPDNIIRDITGIEKCVNLERLILGGTEETDYDSSNEIKDITPLEGLTKLTELNLRENQISDLTPLSNLTNLTELDLGENRISDISPLAGLNNLEKIVLGFNQINDISVLSGLDNLTVLWLDVNPINDITPLSNLTKLTGLDLAKNKISDIQPLVENKGIGEGNRVGLKGNPLNDEGYNVHIPALQERGVKVGFDPKP